MEKQLKIELGHKVKEKVEENEMKLKAKKDQLEAKLEELSEGSKKEQLQNEIIEQQLEMLKHEESK